MILRRRKQKAATTNMLLCKNPCNLQGFFNISFVLPSGACPFVCFMIKYARVELLRLGRTAVRFFGTRLKFMIKYPKAELISY